MPRLEQARIGVSDSRQRFRSSTLASGWRWRHVRTTTSRAPKLRLNSSTPPEPGARVEVVQLASAPARLDDHGVVQGVGRTQVRELLEHRALPVHAVARREQEQSAGCDAALARARAPQLDLAHGEQRFEQAQRIPVALAPTPQTVAVDLEVFAHGLRARARDGDAFLVRLAHRAATTRLVRRQDIVGKRARDR
jgi:hypothetical protein